MQPGLGSMLNGAGEEGEGACLAVMIMAQNICSRSEHMQKKGLLREGHFRVLDFLAGTVYSNSASQDMAERVLH